MRFLGSELTDDFNVFAYAFLRTCNMDVWSRPTDPAVGVCAELVRSDRNARDVDLIESRM